VVDEFMKEISFEDLALWALIAGVVAFVLTDIPRRFLDAWAKKQEKTQPWWLTGVLQAVSVVVGTVTGYLLDGVPWGLTAGIAGGGFATWIVGVLKARAKRALGVKK
jgi:hypothetical protein